MDKMIFTMLNSMKNVQHKQTNNAHEIANVITPGFKKSFSEQTKSLDVHVDGALNSRAMPISKATNIVDMNPGALMISGRALDIYVNDAGALVVQGPEGQELYTRRGDLSVSANGMLVTGTGHLVIGDDGPITVPQGTNISIANDGRVNMIPPGSHLEVQVGRIKLVNTADQDMLIREDGLYQLEKGDLPLDGEIRITPKALEGSNVNAVDAMVRMIQLSRQYEMAVNMIKNAREVDAASASTMRLS
ncbi:MAG: flagellar basal body rod protein FlgF [Oceanospirillaceae bacterium]|jgi:flagellar basal-body rod protein FlgF|nr:flagellar basal body rod protein FlgF [Oceanospirillaceae bacterium]MBT4442712.1 flagellar basal body rod protein FlgF [Oceanospirillaceae bacterium]MBT6078597.1 flagellar basal body rod protein FlgF [Oceanospirillaceae bacterium]